MLDAGCVWEKPVARNEDKPLNTKQQLFAQNIAAGMTQKDAYLRAGYTQCDDRVAAVRGHQLTKEPHIRKHIDKLVAERMLLNQGLEEARSHALETSFNADDITLTWFRLEMLENVRQARELGKIGDANKALIAIAMTKGWFKDHDKPGRPPLGATTQTPEERENAQSHTTLNLQIVNRIVDQALDAGGSQHPARSAPTGETGTLSRTVMLDDKSGEAVFSLDGFAGSSAERILGTLADDGLD